MVPRYGVNLQWLYTSTAAPRGPDERVLDAMAAWGFDFLRLPTDYRLCSVGGDPHHADEAVLVLIDDVLAACRQRGIHLSLDLHRAPGYIITGWQTEPYNLWADEAAQDAFVATWERFAGRYRGVPADALSFDLVNEPRARPARLQPVRARGRHPARRRRRPRGRRRPAGGRRRDRRPLAARARFEERDGFRVDRARLELM